MTEIKKRGLGRGLSSLLSPRGEEGADTIVSLSVNVIEKGAYQPRKHFDEDELRDLATSIKQFGVLQPILVRASGDGKYELIAGERRWRASKLAGLAQIPVIVRYYSDKEMLEIGLLENIQRQDLNPIEEARGYQQLLSEFTHTQDSLSQILGKSRSHISNTLRLLTLPQDVQDHLLAGKLSSGHGRALLAAENPEQLAQSIMAGSLSVRETEALVKEKKAPSSTLKAPKPSSAPPPANSDLAALEMQLSDLAGRPVKIALKGSGGEVSLIFKNPADLEKLMDTFRGLKTSGTAKSVWY